jgi:hypothetical protein
MSKENLKNQHAFVARKGLIVEGDTFISGTLSVETINITGSVSQSISASYALTASYVDGMATAGIEIADSVPTSPQIGETWFNSLDGNTYIYYSASTWVPLSSNEIAYAQTSSYIDATNIDFSNIPVSQSGLQAGQLYNDNGSLKIA